MSYMTLYSLLPKMDVYYHLLTYLHNWLWAYKTGNISETVQDKAKLTINGP